MQSNQVRNNLDTSTSDTSPKNVERIGKFEVYTKLRYAATNPLFEETWKDFYSLRVRADAMVSCEEDK